MECTYESEESCFSDVSFSSRRFPLKLRLLELLLREGPSMFSLLKSALLLENLFKSRLRRPSPKSALGRGLAVLEPGDKSVDRVALTWSPSTGVETRKGGV